LLIRRQGLSFEEHKINLLFVASERNRVIAPPILAVSREEKSNTQVGGGWLTVLFGHEISIADQAVDIILAHRVEL
jgi:hypothetical protein